MSTDYRSQRATVIQACLAVLERDNDLSRSWAVKTLGKMRAQEALSALMTLVCHDPDADVRLEAAAALGLLAAPQAVPALTEALWEDPDGDVRIQACLALGDMAGEEALQALRRAAMPDALGASSAWGEGVGFSAAWEVQRKALEMLAIRPETRVSEVVLRLLQDDAYDDLQEVGFRILARTADAKARAFLRQQLLHGHRLARRRAARALQHAHHPDMLQLVLEAVQHADPEVRCYAAQALAQHEEARVWPLSTALLHDPHPDVRRAGIALTAQAPVHQMAAQLMPLLNDPQHTVRLSVVQALGERRLQSATAALLALLDVTPGATQMGREIIIALGKISAPEVLPALGKLLVHGQLPAETRLQATLAVGAILSEIAVRTAPDEFPHSETGRAEGQDALEVLRQLLGDADEAVRFAALLSWSKIGGDRAVEILAQALHGEISPVPAASTPATTESASDALPPSRPQTSTLAVIQAAVRREGQPTVASPVVVRPTRQQQRRRHAATVARHVPDRRLIEPLLQAAADDDPLLQREALLTLSHLGVPQALPLALTQLRASAREVRLAALEALGNCPPPEAAAPIIALVQTDADALVVQHGIEALAQLADRRATPALISKLADQDRHVRQAALAALARLGARDSMEQIRGCIFAQAGELRLEAVRALKTLADPDLVLLLLHVLNDPTQQEEHWIALEALAEVYAEPVS